MRKVSSQILVKSICVKFHQNWPNGLATNCNYRDVKVVLPRRVNCTGTIYKPLTGTIFKRVIHFINLVFHEINTEKKRKYIVFLRAERFLSLIQLFKFFVEFISFYSIDFPNYKNYKKKAQNTCFCITGVPTVRLK